MTTAYQPALQPGELFDSFAGLPLHPLVVHLVVVVLPLAALLFILVVFVRRWRRPFDLIAVVGLAIGAAGALLAKETGEALSRQVGLPQQHADWGSILVYLAAVLLVVASVWVFLDRRGSEQRSPLIIVASIVGVLLAIATIVMTVLVGHTGAASVWGRILTSDTVTTPEPASTTDASTGVTMAQVAQHSTEADCWSAVAGNAYNLTSWIAQHPGGQQVILAMCGVDSTEAFATQHGGQREPERELASFLVGPVTG